MKKKTISDLIVEYFKEHPREDMPHGPVIDWVEEQYLKLYGKKPRDTWRSIRKLYQEGKLIKERAMRKLASQLVVRNVGLGAWAILK